MSGQVPREMAGWDRADHYVKRILHRWALAPEAEVVRHGGRRFTGGELGAMVRGTAAGLSALGICRESVVAALTAPNDPLMLVVRYATNLLGARIVYLRSINPRSEEVGLSLEERLGILRETDAAVIFSDRDSLAEVSALRRQYDPGIPVCGFDLAEAPYPDVESLTPLDVVPRGIPDAVSREATAAIIYTSGTTGAPKGVCLSAGGWDSMVRGFAKSQSRPLTFLAVTPISQAAASMVDGCLAAGGTVVLEPAFDAGRVLEAIGSEGVTGLYIAVPHLYALLDHPELAATDLSGLRTLIYSGTPASPRRLEEACRVFGNCLIQSYGTTEAGPIAVLLPMAHRSPDLRRTVGRPLPGVRVRICDPRTGQDVAPGATGEVWVRSPTVMTGYLAGSQPFSDEGWLRTGDLGTFDARGYVVLGGRLEDVIKCRGIKVFPRVVEEALIAHPGVAQAHVYAVHGEDAIEQIHAAVAVRADAEPTPEELREHVGRTLSPLHVPDVITAWDNLPVLANGKPDRGRMAARTAPAPLVGDRG